MKLTKQFTRMIILLISGILIGIGLLWLVFLLPEKNIYKHGAASLQTFAEEGLYPSVGTAPADKLDNWTDSLMISTAIFKKEDASPLNRAMSIYQPVLGDSDPLTSVFAYINGKPEVSDVSYSRYWHGYLTLLRPLLTVMDYNGIRTCNNIGVILLLVLVAGSLIWKKHYALLIPVFLTFLFLRPLAIVFSMQYSSIYYLTMFTVLWIVLRRSKLSQNFHYLLLFQLNGMLAGYLDLLTYPIVSLGVPLAVFLATQKEDDWIKQCRQVILSSISWGFGYVGMWSAKWLVGSLILKRSVFAEAAAQAKFRLSTNNGRMDFSRIDVFLRNAGAGFMGILPVAAFILAISVLYFLWRNRKCFLNAMCRAVPYFFIMLFPFAWYTVFANHSYIHILFTYRDLAVSVCALECLCLTSDLPAYRKPEISPSPATTK